jgi:hypothetical protein
MTPTSARLFWITVRNLGSLRVKCEVCALKWLFLVLEESVSAFLMENAVWTARAPLERI